MPGNFFQASAAVVFGAPVQVTPETQKGIWGIGSTVHYGRQM